MGPSLKKANLPERRCSKRQARRHSVVVRSARVVLPVFIVALASTYVVMATPQTIDNSFVNQFENLDVATEDMRLDKPRFVGEDAAGRTFELLADAAQQSPDTPDLVALANPEAFKDLGTQGLEYIRALEGLYSAENKTVDLRNNVQIRQGIGADNFELTTETGKIGLENRTFSSDVQVYGKSAQGTISAEGMTAYRDEDKVVFRNAHMRYNVSEEETDDSDADQAGADAPDGTDGDGDAAAGTSDNGDSE
ncbi:LPS export ABC transporter periplasmic protein LptC [Aquisalinus flavus]|uniref:LPS export ABC transporter periplasmic protein LptC n=1 Tax=Aquisalinus flavus TaxID=1526572 RepID=UPI00165F8032|nr:LPS export ABC transporter periplasmic protein LptC [Aquisalinus flavus]MBD0425806.1 LPS export ABC transporter periplasmic protein LptC [Aquisalinus flavus]